MNTGTKVTQKTAVILFSKYFINDVVVFIKTEINDNFDSYSDDDFI